MKFGNKYGARKTERAGRSFGSKLEAAVFDLLCLREKAGEIKDIRQQQKVYLTEAKILYIADYSYEEKETGKLVYVEAKGCRTASWNIKLKLFRVYGPAPLEIWVGDYRKPYHLETVIPKKYEEFSHEHHIGEIHW